MARGVALTWPKKVLACLSRDDAASRPTRRTFRGASHQRCVQREKLHISRAICRRYNPASMLRFHRHAIGQLVQTASELRARIQRLESEQATLRSRLDGERQLQILTAHISAAAQAAPAIGAAIERFAQAMRASLPLPRRGHAGGLARAKGAWRYLDGTFMPESEKEVMYIQEYERYAAGGRARASRAQRASDGTFI